MVTFGAVFDAAQKTHGCVGADRVVELHRVQIFDGNPPENGPILSAEKNTHTHSFSLLSL